MKRLSIYYTPNHFSVTVQNGTQRETSSPNPSQTLSGMPHEDRLVLEAFCRAVLEHGTTGKFPLIVTE